QLPGNFIFEADYVGRLGRSLFAQADAAQVTNFVDPASGQGLFAAFNTISQQVRTGAAVTDQPWFENQISAALGGAPCSDVFGISCTNLVTTFFGNLVRIGDLSDTIQALNFNQVLLNNVGLPGQFSTNEYITNSGSSSYNGLLLSLTKNYSHGFQFN